MSTRTIRQAYDMWPQYNGRLRDVIGAMTPEQLLVRPSPDRWPIWATVGHTAGMRVYWLCTVIGEPGLDATPFSDDPTDGWEDHLDLPRIACQDFDEPRAGNARNLRLDDVVRVVV